MRPVPAPARTDPGTARLDGRAPTAAARPWGASDGSRCSDAGALRLFLRDRLGLGLNRLLDGGQLSGVLLGEGLLRRGRVLDLGPRLERVGILAQLLLGGLVDVGGLAAAGRPPPPRGPAPPP